MVHRRDCRALSRVNPDRILPAYWQTGEKGKVISFCLLFHDVPGLLNRVTQIIYDMGVNIIDLTVKAKQDSTCQICISLEIRHDDTSFLDRLVERVRTHIPEYLLKEADFFDK